VPWRRESRRASLLEAFDIREILHPTGGPLVGDEVPAADEIDFNLAEQASDPIGRQRR